MGLIVNKGDIMEIKSCVVNTISKEELRAIETICFEQDIVRCGSGRDHLEMDVDRIKICEDISIISGNYPELPHYTAYEFIKKFGKVTGYKSKYRIKTKEEFIEEFGEGWRNKTGYYFADSMDCLFGKGLTEDEAEEYLTRSEIEIDAWNISKDMITEIKQKKPNIIDKFITTQKVTLNDSLYRHKKVNLNQND